MTLRIDLACAAMAALVLMTSNVTAAHAAAITPCDVMPTRCGYGSNGVLYFYPPGYGMPNSAETPRNGTVRSPNQAAWGCGATDGNARARTWNSPNRAAASYGALSACDRLSRRGTCRIISCRPSVHTIYDAQKIWRPYVYR
jgi:hypothetical protein